MIFEPQTSLINPIFLEEFLRISVFIILVLYSLFALLIVRQVTLMSRALVTPVSPIVKAFSIIHAGFAIGLTVFIVGTL